MELALIKEYIKVTTSDAQQDDLIEKIAEAAVAAVSHVTFHMIGAKDYRQVFDGGQKFLEPQYKPLNDIIEVKILENEQVIDHATELMTIGDRIYYSDGSRFPPYTIMLEYNAGYSNLESAPSDWKLAVLVLIERMWVNRAMAASNPSAAGAMAMGTIFSMKSDFSMLLRNYWEG
jgi:hypothetical protein